MSGSENPAPQTRRIPNGSRTRRRWLPYFGAVVLLGLLALGLWPKPLPVEVASVGSGPLRATVNEEGKTRIKQRYVVSAPITGQLRRIPFKAGAEAIAGQTLMAEIEPLSPNPLDVRTRATTEARRDTAAANVEKARVNHVFAASEFRRFKKLFDDKTISVQEFEAAQLREASAQKEQVAAESALRQAEAELAESSGNGNATNSTCTPQIVKAPATGRILHVFEENARVVSAGTPLVEIGDPTDLEIVIEVLSRDGAGIQPGTKIEFEQWGGGQPLLGQVRLVEPAAFTKISALGVEEQRVNVIADFTTPVEARRNVGDNFRVEARIIVWENTDALKVPVGALFRQGDSWASFVVVNGTAQLRLVKAGRSSGTETQILEGLRSGDQVIVYPGSRVKDGQKIKLTKT